MTKSFAYDKERVEGIYFLVAHYYDENLHEIANGYYNLIKTYYENTYLSINIYDQNKLFLNLNIYNLYLPYYMIFVSDKLQDKILGLKMYEIIFTKKSSVFNEVMIKHLLFNFQFFINHIPLESNEKIINLANVYLKFLFDNNVPLSNFTILKEYEKYNIDINYIFPKENNYSQCINSTNILFYTGYNNMLWNYSYSIYNALGGSEKAVAYLTKCFPKHFNIYISGSVKKEKIDNITFVPLNKLKNLVNNTCFHTVIVSRYIAFYDMFPQTIFYQSYIWAHDTQLLHYGSSLTVEHLLNKYNHKINGCICLTQYHKELFINKYPMINNKINIINNGINCDQFSKNISKQKNKFIYSSCSERGLDILLNLWEKIIKYLPDATLVIASYNDFPYNEFDKKLKLIIDRYSSIQHLGKLNTSILYMEMASSEYWLYPCTYPETSCITAFEMLMSNVIPIYYPCAGLVYTLNGHGIKTTEQNEISDILKLTDESKDILRENGKKYAETCSWNCRAIEWSVLLFTEIKYEIKIINLKHRVDRKDKIINQLKKYNIENYNIFEGIYGKELKSTTYIQQLFRNNDFKYRKGVIGCALSHLKIYEQLIHDNDNDLYVILEDDIELVDNFKEKLNYCINECKNNNYEYTFISGFGIKNKNTNIDNLFINNFKFTFDSYGTSGYIINKKGAIKILEYINKYGLQFAIDAPSLYNNSLINMYSVNEYIGVAPYCLFEGDSDIQRNCDNFDFLQNDNMELSMLGE